MMTEVSATVLGLVILCLFMFGTGYGLGWFYRGSEERLRAIDHDLGEIGHELEAWRRATTIAPFGHGDWIITYPDGRQYVGAGTVWHRYPSGERCATRVEAVLADEFERLKWRDL